MSLQDISLTELREMLIEYFGDHVKAMLHHDHVAFDKSKALLSRVIEEMYARGYEVQI